MQYFDIKTKPSPKQRTMLSVLEWRQITAMTAMTHAVMGWICAKSSRFDYHQLSKSTCRRLCFARKHVNWKVKKYMTYFQMVFQKLCQNSVSGWGSLEEFWFLPWASPSGKILRLRHLQDLNDLVQVVQGLAVALQLFVPALQSCLNFEAGNSV